MRFLLEDMFVLETEFKKTFVFTDGKFKKKSYMIVREPVQDITMLRTKM